MANEDRRPPLQEYVEARLLDIKDEIRRELDLRFAGSDRHWEKVLEERRVQLDERFRAQEAALAQLRVDIAVAQAKSNEWRGTLDDHTRNLVSREQWDTAHQALLAKLDVHAAANDQRALIIDRSVTRLESRVGYVSGTIVMSAMALLMSLGFGAASLLHSWSAVPR